MIKYELTVLSRKLLVIAFVAVAFFIGLLIGNVLIGGGITGNVVSNQLDKNYTWTSAICDNNKCLDVLIECENGSVKSLKPMSDFVEFSEGWEDPRSGKIDYCE
ncbi:MAG: hypothetical protein Q7R87_01790 [Nanoarchaeota archaeon]|nr:hypothetical protein [Nanoarchaeota archaeon]